MRTRTFSLDDLAHRYNLTRRWWQDHVRELVEAGVLVKRGNVWFGDERRLDHYLATGEVLELLPTGSYFPRT